jgi:hypothetical protein
MTFANTHSATFSPGSEDGHTPCDSPDGPMTDLFGQALAPASHSAQPARSVAATMSATYGLRSSGSYASAALKASLASRLPALLDSHGSTMFALTWKEQITPLRRRICALLARAHRTSGSGSTGWQTPKANELARSERFVEGRDMLSQLECLAGWPTATAQDHFSANATANRKNPDSKHHSGTTLTDAARMAWATPSARDWKDTGPIKPRSDGTERMDQLPRQAYLTRGATSNGSPAATASPGQLNPAFSRWLMGYPREWCEAAIEAWHQMPTKARKGE